MSIQIRPPRPRRRRPGDAEGMARVWLSAGDAEGMARVWLSAGDRGATVVRLYTFPGSPVSVPFYERHMGYRRRSILFQKPLS